MLTFIVTSGILIYGLFALHLINFGILYVDSNVIYKYDDYDVELIALRIEDRSFDGISVGKTVHTRKEFPESWIFEVVQKYAKLL